MEEKHSKLGDPHVARLTELVKRWRADLPNDHHLPWFDPCDGGVEARILFILEKPGPGPKRGGVDFVSQDNKDRTAPKIKGALEKLGVDRSQVAFWNAVSAWNGRMPITAAELDQGAIQVQEVLQLMPSVRSLVLAGRNAEKVFRRMRAAGFQLPTHTEVFVSPHPAMRGLTIKDAIDRLAEAWKDAFERARSAIEDEGRYHKDAAESDTCVALRRTREANSGLMAYLRETIGELALEQSINQRLTELMREADEKAAVANQLRELRDRIGELSGRCDRLAQEAARQERQIDSLEFREFLQRGESLTAAGRLELILGQDRWLPSAFPDDWAEISNADLAGLPEAHRQALATRISRVKRGPWRRLYVRLAGA